MSRGVLDRGPSASSDSSALTLLVGQSSTTNDAAENLGRAGVRTVTAGSGHDALARLADLSPDLVIIKQDELRDVSGTELIGQIAGVRGAPMVVVIGEPHDTEATASPQQVKADFLPADVGVAELVDHVRSKLHFQRTSARPRIAPHRLAEEIGRELQRSELSRRPGVLAAVSVAELSRLRERLGSQAEEAVWTAFDEFCGLDAQPLEQHSSGPDGGIWLLMPETTSAAAAVRLQALSRRVADARLDIGGEHVRLTPVIGFSEFTAAASGNELRNQAITAQRDACLHLDLVPVRFSPALGPALSAISPARDRWLTLAERLRVPLQVGFTVAVLLTLPFIIYVVVWYVGFDLTKVTYPLMAAALTVTAAAIWIESFRAVAATSEPPVAVGPPPAATAIVAAYLPNEAATIVDTIVNLLVHDYPSELQVILAYNTPRPLPIEETLAEIASIDSRLLVLRVEGSTSKAQNINAALAYVSGEFVGVFDADHHPHSGSFSRAWSWLSNGHDIVQGHCVVRNGDASWLAQLIAVEFETVYAVSHPGRARLHGFGIFGGSNGYWRRDALRQIRMQRSMLTEDIDSSMRSLREGFSIVSDPALISTELAPTTLGALWNQRMRWAQGWTQTAWRHLGPALRSPQLSARQKLGAAFLLGWAQLIPWITIQVFPILAFVAWRDGGLGKLDWLVPLFVLLSLFTFSVGAGQAVFAYVLGDETVRRHRSWFVLYGIHSILWYGEFKNLIARVAQLKQIIGERQWRVTPRSAPSVVSVASSVERSEPNRGPRPR